MRHRMLLIMIGWGLSVPLILNAALSGGSGGEKLKPGTWGGQHIQMEVTENGATLEFDCGNASIDEPIKLDSRGHFRAKGKYQNEGGPARAEDDSRTKPVIFEGSVQGDKMTLGYAEAGQKPAETFTLERGRKVRLMNCM